MSHGIFEASAVCCSKGRTTTLPYTSYTNKQDHDTREARGASDDLMHYWHAHAAFSFSADRRFVSFSPLRRERERGRPTTPNRELETHTFGGDWIYCTFVPGFCSRSKRNTPLQQLLFHTNLTLSFLHICLWLRALAWTSTCSRQVVVSGPSGFVFYVEGILAEMGVPESAIVLLD